MNIDVTRILAAELAVGSLYETGFIDQGQIYRDYGVIHWVLESRDHAFSSEEIQQAFSNLEKQGKLVVGPSPILKNIVSKPFIERSVTDLNDCIQRLLKVGIWTEGKLEYDDESIINTLVNQRHFFALDRVKAALKSCRLGLKQTPVVPEPLRNKGVDTQIPLKQAILNLHYHNRSSIDTVSDEEYSDSEEDELFKVEENLATTPKVNQKNNLNVGNILLQIVNQRFKET